VKLNKLWNQYIQTLLGKDDPTNPNHMASICSKIVKADLTGANLRISASKNQSLVGITGIVVRESVRCIFIINEKNEVKNIQKAGSVFEVQLPCSIKDSERVFGIRIWGDNIIHLGSERTKVRFKEKFALDLY
jgi:RNase P/RNase MRP subunit p29